MSVKAGQLVTLTFEGRNFEAIVIDPNGLGPNQPSIGFGFRMMEKHGGLASSTISDWVTKESGLEGVRDNELKTLKRPGGMVFRVSEITGSDKNKYLVLEVSEWVALAADILKKPGKINKSTQSKLIDFLTWFAVKGFYADAYVNLKNAYTDADSRAVSAWMQARLTGISTRNQYTKFLQQNGCEEWYHYANWTDCIYEGLFGMKKKEMVENWDVVEGNKNIGRNHIPEVKGLEAVAYCENQVIQLFHEDLEQAHNDAITYARKKFKLELE